MPTLVELVPYDPNWRSEFSAAEALLRTTLGKWACTGLARSNKLADYYGVKHPELRGHDALDDARSVAYTLQFLLQSGKLLPSAFGS